MPMSKQLGVEIAPATKKDNAPKDLYSYESKRGIIT